MTKLNVKYIENLEALIMKQANLGYADVKLNFVCMHPADWARRVSLCEYYDLCAQYALSITLLTN